MINFALKTEKRCYFKSLESLEIITDAVCLDR